MFFILLSYRTARANVGLGLKHLLQLECYKSSNGVVTSFREHALGRQFNLAKNAKKR